MSKRIIWPAVRPRRRASRSRGTAWLRGTSTDISTISSSKRRTSFPWVPKCLGFLGLMNAIPVTRALEARASAHRHPRAIAQSRIRHRSSTLPWRETAASFTACQPLGNLPCQWRSNSRAEDLGRALQMLPKSFVFRFLEGKPAQQVLQAGLNSCPEQGQKLSKT